MLFDAGLYLICNNSSKTPSPPQFVALGELSSGFAGIAKFARLGRQVTRQPSTRKRITGPDDRWSDSNIHVPSRQATFLTFAF